jgi:hypothetical protein
MTRPFLAVSGGVILWRSPAIDEARHWPTPGGLVDREGSVLRLCELSLTVGLVPQITATELPHRLAASSMAVVVQFECGTRILRVIHGRDAVPLRQTAPLPSMAEALQV